MQLLFVISKFALVTLLVASPAQAREIKKIKEPFKFELITSNIFQWVTGERSGVVGDEKGKMATRLDGFLARSQQSVDAAIYGVNKQSWFLDRVGSLANKNRKIRFVVDQAGGEVNDWTGSNFIYPDTALLPSIIPEEDVKVDIGASGEVRSSIMHNKFLVVDNRKVWLGSVNISNTEIGSEYNANSVIIVDSKDLAEIYASEFKQMFEDNLFSRRKVQNESPQIAFSDGTHVEVFFSPQDNVKASGVIPFVQQAKETLNIGMFYLTDKDVIEEIAKAAQERKVKVRVICDALAANSSVNGAFVGYLRKRGVDLRIENWGGKMHMKTAVADDKNILIGSMNWSASGSQNNDENTMIIRNNPTLGQSLNRYFDKLWSVIGYQSSSTKVYAEGHDSINSCFDGLDNDYDGKVDADDPGCK